MRILARKGRKYLMSRKLLTTLGLMIPVLVLFATGCSDTTGTGLENGADTTAVPTPDNPLDGFVTVAPNVQVHYLDFGGTGEPLLLLAGFGNTANVFRTLAPLLTDQYRVRAVTRRGFGQSDQPVGGYDRTTLANDIRVLLDSVGVSTAHLVGHSLAGDEMSRLAVNYPGRVGKLVYLDAGYDRTTTSAVLDTSWTIPPNPTVADLASAVAYRDFLAGVIGVSVPVEEISATNRMAADGSLIGPVTPSAVAAAVLAGVEAPNYGGIAASALSIYAIPLAVTDVAPWMTSASPGWATAQTEMATLLVPWIEAQRDRFAAEVANSTVIEIGVKHYMFLSNPEQVAAAVIAFLEGG
jgi:pimeloyl-ACP methyl ester carboxylesterase